MLGALSSAASGILPSYILHARHRPCVPTALHLDVVGVVLIFICPRRADFPPAVSRHLTLVVQAMDQVQDCIFTHGTAPAPVVREHVSTAA